MSTETNKSVVHQWLDLWNDHALDQLGALVAPSYIHHTSSGQDVTFDGFVQGFGWILRAYPDMHYTIEHMLAESDLVAVYLIGQGTLQGEFFGVAPAGQASIFRGVYHCRVQDGKILEDWDIFDLMTALARLGARMTLAK